MVIVWGAYLILAGCQNPGAHRIDVDHRALGIISAKQEQLLGRKETFTVERPSDTLRRRLIEQLSLPGTGPSSLGSDLLLPVDHWPEQGFPGGISSRDLPILELPLQLTLFQALEVGARNSPDFQAKKESVFQAALVLYLEQESFRNSFLGQIKSLVSSDGSGDSSRAGSLTGGELNLTRQFQNGMKLTTVLAVDLATLFTSGGSSSMGIAGDASLSIPLLRGSANHIITEPLHQAERNLVYAILDFQQFRMEFAAAVGSSYLTILKQLDTVENTGEDYKSRIVSVRRSSRLADAGRLKEIEVDQAVQTELISRLQWVSAREEYKKQMDNFKKLIGLPPDADMLLDADELKRLAEISGIIPPNEAGGRDKGVPAAGSLPANGEVLLPEPDTGHAGPLELSTRRAIELALANRLDMKVALGRVFDAQRAVVVAADDLNGEVTLLGTASLGELRTITTADLENARLKTDKGLFSALLTLDLPFERTAEAVTYRNSFIKLEQAVRDVQNLEDTLKLEVRSRLRELLEARETIYIQAKAVFLALKRVKSIMLFMEAGRAETRDLLEAQDDLLAAQNGLTSARVNYRIAELEIQRDMGLLTVTDKGLWQEYLPERQINVEK